MLALDLVKQLLLLLVMVRLGELALYLDLEGMLWTLELDLLLVDQ